MLQRRLDAWVGIPLVFLAGLANRARRVCVKPSPEPGEIRRVGVLCLGAIGDLLLASGLLSGLRRELPNATIEIIVSKANAPCGALLHPAYDTAVFAVADVPALVRHVRSRRYDLFIDIGQWPRISALIAALSGAGRTVGFSTPGQFRHYAYDHAVPHRDDCHELNNFLALGRVVFPHLAGEPEIVVPETGGTATIALPENAVLCHMWPSGLKSSLKEWPQEYWAELAQRLLAGGYVSVFTGGPGDAAATEAFMRDFLPDGCGAVSLAGRVSLPDLARHIQGVRAVVSVNTGIMHLAAILGAPTVALHGPTNPLRWGPVGPRAISLLPEKGHCAYLNLGFEYPVGAEAVMRHLPVSHVLSALVVCGLDVQEVPADS